MTELKEKDWESQIEVRGEVDEIRTSLKLERIFVGEKSIRQIIKEAKKRRMVEAALLAPDFTGLSKEPLGKLATKGMFEAIIFRGRCLRQGLEPTVEIVKGIHTRVVHYIDPRIGGVFRTVDVSMSDGAFTPSSWEKIPKKMQEYEEELLARTSRLTLAFDSVPDVVQAASWAHCRLAKIQPFLDGNKRTTRLFANYILMRHGLVPVTRWEPKAEYFRAFYQSLDQGTPIPFARFLAARLVDKYEMALRKIPASSCPYYQDIYQKSIMLQRTLLGQN